MKYGYEEHDDIDDDGGSGDAQEPVFQPDSNQETCFPLQQGFFFFLAIL